MKNELLDSIKQAAYLLWEFMKQEEPMALWKCAEDIACFFESNDILEEEDMLAIMKNDVYCPAYIDFIRNISYRMYFYTGQYIPSSNWYCAKKLMSSSEWRLSVSRLAKLLRAGKQNPEFIASLHNTRIKEYYSR